MNVNDTSGKSTGITGSNFSTTVDPGTFRDSVNLTKSEEIIPRDETVTHSKLSEADIKTVSKKFTKYTENLFEGSGEAEDKAHV